MTRLFSDAKPSYASVLLPRPLKLDAKIATSMSCDLRVIRLLNAIRGLQRMGLVSETSLVTLPTFGKIKFRGLFPAVPQPLLDTKS
jgi:hypothetical protein